MKAARILVMAVSLVVAVACLVAIWFAVRAVMGVGGACAEGGAYEIQTSCPQGSAGILTLGIPLGLVAVLAYAWANDPLPGPDLTMLAWPALFVSLGYTFIEGAVRSIGSDGGGVIIGLVCGVVFILMGLAPLVSLRSAAVRRRVFWAHSADDESGTMWSAMSKRRTAAAALKAAEADGHLTREEIATVRAALDHDEAAETAASGARSEGSWPMALLQLAAIVVGLGVGTWVSASMLT